MIIQLNDVQLAVLKAIPGVGRASIQDLSKSTQFNQWAVKNAVQVLIRKKVVEGSGLYQLTQKGKKFLEDPLTSASQVVKRIGPSTIKPIAFESGTPIVNVQRILAFERDHDETYRMPYYCTMETIVGLSVLLQSQGDTVKGFDCPWNALAYAGQAFNWAISTRKIKATQLSLPDKLYDFADFRNCPKELLAFFPIAKAKLESQE